MSAMDTSAEAMERLLAHIEAMAPGEALTIEAPVAFAGRVRALLARAERAEAVLLAVADATATEGVNVGVLLARIGMVTQSFRDAALLDITSMKKEDMTALFLAAPHVPMDAERDAFVADNARLLGSVTAESEARVKAEAERDALRETASHLRKAAEWAEANGLDGTAEVNRQNADALEAEAQHAAAIAAAREEGRRGALEEAARTVDCGCAARADVLARLATDGEKRASYLCTRGDACCALQAASIRALAQGGEP